MAGKAKKIGLIVTVLILAGLAVGYFMWNKPHKNINAAAGIKITAAELYQSFITDSATANSKYIDKVLEVTGIVKNTSINQQQQPVVSLQTTSGEAAVNCTLEQKEVEIKEGEQVRIKGICTGIGEGDADLGIMGDVYLIRCYIEK